MQKWVVVIISILFVFLVMSCAQQQVPIEDPVPADDVDDGIVQEAEEPVVDEPEAVVEQKQMDPEVEELLGKAADKVTSLTYSYRGPETNEFTYEFSVKGSLIKYELEPTSNDIRLDEAGYNYIYLNTATKTAGGYCDGFQCKVSGKKTDLVYADVYIPTPFDWLADIEYAEKLGEELLEKRATWKLDADVGTIWIDTFYGVPMQVEIDGQLYEFLRMTFNDVKDEDVTPQD